MLNRLGSRFFTLFFIFLICLFFAGCKDSSSKKPNVLFVVVDTLGAKHLQSFANNNSAESSLAKTPNIEALAKDGVVFSNAFSAAPWTKASVASMFTGIVPQRHRVQNIDSKLSDSHHTLAEMFKESGYQTKGIISHILLKEDAGFGQGFEQYGIVPLTKNVHDEVNSNLVTETAIDWLKTKRSHEKPFFLFTHYFDPHYNFQHHPEFNRTAGYQGTITPGEDVRSLRARIPNITSADIDYLKGLYHEEIAFTDLHLGRLFAALKSEGLAENTLIILTADHGEEFMEHGWIGHTKTLYNDLVQVPLIFYWPSHFRSQRIDTAVSLCDLVPTLNALIPLNQNISFDGISIEPLLQGGSLPDRPIFFEVNYKVRAMSPSFNGILYRKWKLIKDRSDNSLQLFDIIKDPDEKINLAATEPIIVEKLLASLDNQDKDYTSQPGASTLEEKDPHKLEQLRSLGYL